MLGQYFKRSNKIKNDQLMGPEEYLASKRILCLYGTMDEYIRRFDAFGPTLIMDLLLTLDQESNDPIKLIIDSPGGFMDVGFSLYDTIKSLKSPVWTYGRSCQSMATLILASGEKEHRHVYPNSRTMIHLPFAQISGNTEDVKVQQKEIEKLKEMMVDSLIDCGAVKNKKQILKDMDREYWMSANEACEYGIVDQVVKRGDI